MEREEATGADDAAVELLKYGVDCIIKLLLRIFNKCMNIGTAPEDWKVVCFLVNNKSRDRSDCDNYRGISILCLPGKVNNRHYIGKLSERNKESRGEPGVNWE